MKRLFLLGFLSIAFSFPTPGATEIPTGYKLNYQQSFNDPSSLKDFVFSDPKAWRWTKEEKGGGSLELFGKSVYEPKHRSPFNIALLADKVFGDFILEVDLLSTVKPYPHQDMCLFFGFEATNKFYYTHIAVKPDPVKKDSHAHDIFIVNDAPRLAIASEISPGVVWGDNVWHKVRVVRKVSDGSIKVYFDDMAKPIMVADDKTFGTGGIGFGSFDDMGKIDNIKIWSPSVETRKMDFFKSQQP